MTETITANWQAELLGGSRATIDKIIRFLTTNHRPVVPQLYGVRRMRTMRLYTISDKFHVCPPLVFTN